LSQSEADQNAGLEILSLRTKNNLRLHFRLEFPGFESTVKGMPLPVELPIVLVWRRIITTSMRRKFFWQPQDQLLQWSAFHESLPLNGESCISKIVGQSLSATSWLMIVFYFLRR
jgi:hypothetical protein